MKRLQAVAAAALAVSLAGCIVNGKPKTVAATPPPPQPAPATAPAPPPGPLSVPQTQVTLPADQPLTPEALATTEPPQQTAGPAPVARPRPARHATSPPAAPRAETPAPATAPAAPPEPERPPVQEILNPAEMKREQDLADAHKREIRQWLTPARAARLNKDTVARIESFLKASDDAERRNDMREANDLAERALVLLRELQGAQ